MADTVKDTRYLSYTGLEEYDGLIKAHIKAGLDGKSDTGHDHDGRYYTETEIDTKLTVINDSIGAITGGTTVVEKAKHAETATSATNATNATTASKLGSTTVGGATEPIYLNGGSPTKASKYAGGTAVTLNGTSKAASTASFFAPETAGTSGYILKSNGSGAPVWLQTLPVANGGTGATTASGARTNLGVYSTSEVDAKIDSANTYTDGKIALLLNNSSDAVDSIMELATAMEENDEVVAALEQAIGTKQATITGAATTITGNDLTTSRALISNGSGKVAVSTVTSTELGYLSGVTSAIQTQLNGKAPKSHAANTTTYGGGTGTDYGHVKLSDATNSESGASSSIAATPAAVKAAYDLAASKDANQNAFSNIVVGSTTVAADAPTDSVTFVGSNVTITADATNDKVTFSVANGSTSAKGVVQLTNSATSTSTTTAATPAAVKSVYDIAVANTSAISANTASIAAFGEITSAQIIALFE